MAQPRLSAREIATEPFRCGHAAAEDWKEALARCCAGLGRAPAPGGLGFVFMSDAMAAHHGAVLQGLRASTGCESWIGTVGVGVCSTGVEYYARPALAAMICDLPPEAFRLFGVRDAHAPLVTPELGEWLRREAPVFGFLHCDPRTRNLPHRLARLAHELGEAYLVGGVSSSRGALVQIAGEDQASPVSGALISGRVGVATRVTQGCWPIGPAREITGIRGGAIVSIDRRPATDVLFQDAGELVRRDPERIAGHIFAGIPVRGADNGDYLVRDIVRLDPRKRALAVAEPLDVGDRILFCRRDPQSAEEDLHRMLRAISPPGSRPARGAIYYDCIARGEAQFGDDSRELALIRQHLGDVPLVGFMGGGEVANARLYAYTGVLTLFL